MRKLAALWFTTMLGVVAAVLSMRKLFRSREDTRWTDAKLPGRCITVDGVAVHYVESAPPIGANVPAIVMVHGFGGNTYSFRYQLAALGQDYRCVALDLKGFGYSERPVNSDYSLTAQARLVLGAMDALGIERATLIGHSMGGEVVMRVAEMAPERVEKLVLAATVPGRKAWVAPRMGFMRPLMVPIARISAWSSWKRLFYDPSRLDLAAIRAAYTRPARIHGSLNTVWEMWEDVRRDAQIDFKRIKAPVLILWAEKERILPLPGRSLKWLQKRLPKATTVTIPRTGHMLLEEQPAGLLNLHYHRG
ncbi:MAG: alpha/beta hydrolase, partial [Dehalococcoidia bacterium]